MNSDMAYQGLGGAFFAMIGIWSVIGIGIYVWYLWALARLFPYLGLPKAHGWIPIWNQWRLIERGGLPGWMVLLGLVPFLSIVVLIVSIIAIHRINTEHREGAGMTVLGAFIPPLWATILGSRLRDRGYNADPAGTNMPTGQFAGRGVVEYGPNGQVYPMLNNGAAAPGSAPMPPQAPLPAHAPPTTGPSFSMPAVPKMAPGAQGSAAQPANPVMPPAPAMPPAPGAQVNPPASPPKPAPVAPTADKQWSLGSTVDSNFERLANEENPALDRLFGTNENARPFSWPEPQPHGQTPAAAPAPQLPAAQQPPVQQPPAAPSVMPTFMPPAPPAHAPATEPESAAPAPPAAAPNPAYAPPVQAEPVREQHAAPLVDAPLVDAPVSDAPAVVAPAPDTEAIRAVNDEPVDEDGFDDELDRTVVVARKAAWVLELPDGRELELHGDDVVIGRKPTAVGGSDVLVVPDPTRTLSKSHARLRRDGESWTIEDLNSTNGVFVFDDAGVQTEVTPGTAQAASAQLIIGTLEVRLRPAA